MHNNALMMIDAMSSDGQIKNWIEPTIKRGALIPGAGAEPLGTPPTTAKRTGRRLFGQWHQALCNQCNLGGMAVDRPCCVGFASPADHVHAAPGYARSTNRQRYLPSDGIRACVSPWLHLENCFVPKENLLGRPGQFLGENWMGKITFAFTANYLGSARAMDDWALDYVRGRDGGKDSYRQLRFAELKSMIDTARLILYTAARMFKKDPEHPMVAAHEAKWMAKETLQKVMWSTVEVCGSTSLFQNHPLERFYRDMHLPMMHGRHDIAAQGSAHPSSAKPTTSIAHIKRKDER